MSYLSGCLIRHRLKSASAAEADRRKRGAARARTEIDAAIGSVPADVEERRWIEGGPRIVQNQLDRNIEKERRLVVRDTLELVERHVRFQCVRLLGCYQAVLGHLRVETGHAQAAASMPEVALYLEMGAADRTTISRMSLGISRPTATRLAAGAQSRKLDVPDALAWLVYARQLV